MGPSEGQPPTWQAVASSGSKPSSTRSNEHLGPLIKVPETSQGSDGLRVISDSRGCVTGPHGEGVTSPAFQIELFFSLFRDEDTKFSPRNEDKKKTYTEKENMQNDSITMVPH